MVSDFKFVFPIKTIKTLNSNFKKEIELCDRGSTPHNIIRSWKGDSNQVSIGINGTLNSNYVKKKDGI